MQAVRTEEYEREETVSFRVISDLQTVGINVSELMERVGIVGECERG